jgi:hypothetical protein
VTSYTEGFSHFVASMTAPVASGWSDLAGWGLHPLESAALSRRTQTAVVPGRLGELKVDPSPHIQKVRRRQLRKGELPMTLTGEV